MVLERLLTPRKKNRKDISDFPLTKKCGNFMGERELIIRKKNMKNCQSRWKLRFKKKLLSLIQQGKDVVIDFSFWSKENRNFYKELIRKAGAETELVYMKASKELLQKRLYKRNQVLNANSPFVITDEILEHHYHAFQEPRGEGEKVILQK